MRIVHIPYNIASFASESVRALRELGHDARGVVFEPKSILINFDGLKIIWNNNNTSIKNKTSFFFQKYFQTIRHILWADVIHWYWDADLLTHQLELKLIRWLKKPVVIEWLGSDIRNPSVEFSDNPFYKNVYLNEPDYIRTESVQRSSQIQKKFADAGCIPVLCPDMEQYLINDLFPVHFKIHQRLNLKNIKPVYPLATNKKPLVVHSSTGRIIKGTRYVLEAVEQLKAEVDFDFVLIENKPLDEAMGLLKSCDIFLDQFIYGCHGMAAVEAMAYGKPVIGFIKEAMLKNYPADLPIVAANPFELKDQLRILLCDAQLRNSIGIKSRTYAEKYHDSLKVAKELETVYQQVINLKKSNPVT